MEPEIAREKKLLERELVVNEQQQTLNQRHLQLWDLAYCSGKARRRV